jgi:UPF0716 protein FxsA
MRWFFVAFVVVPLTELYLLIWLSRWIGFGWTVAITLVTGVVGGTLAKHEGLRVWRRWASAIAEGRTPESGVAEGLLVLLGGILLLTPGVLTDALGFCLLLPPTRRRIAIGLRAAIERRIAAGTMRVVSHAERTRSRDDAIDTTGESKQ